MLNEPAYILTHDVERFIHYEVGYTADVLIQNVRMDERMRIFEDERVDLPNPVIYSGYLPIIETLDFPLANNSWLIMSKRMINALASVGEFKRHEYPVVITDSRLAPDQWLDGDGQLNNASVIHGFFVVQLLERLEIFDFKRSRFTADPDFPDFIGDVDEYVFEIPVGGLPPIFHIKGEPVKVFITHAARTALKHAGVCGVEYISLKGVQGGDGMFVDVPVRPLRDF